MIILPNDLVRGAASDDRALWLKQRKERWTASVITNVMGLGTDSRNVAIRDMAERREPDENIGELAFVAAGKFMEDAILNWYEAECLSEVTKNRTLMWRNSMPWIGATPDGFEHDGAKVRYVLEVKNVGFDSLHNWHLNTTADKIIEQWKKLELGPFPTPQAVNARVSPIVKVVAKADADTLRGAFRRAIIGVHKDIIPEMGLMMAPLKYWVQLQVQLVVCGVRYGKVIVQVGGNSRFDLTYEKHDDFCDLMLEETRKAWDEVENRRDSK